MFHAHSLTERPESGWQPLADHLVAVGALAGARGGKFGATTAARYAGLLHDLGKYTLAFQRRIRDDWGKVDHATAGAKMAVTLATPSNPRLQTPDLLIARILAHAIAGHHAGLPDSIGTVGALDDRFSRELEPLVDQWRNEIAPDATGLMPPFDLSDVKSGPERLPRALAFFGRMVFSTLVDADFRDTEAFYAAAEGKPVDRDWPRLPDVVDRLIVRLDAHMAALAAGAADTPVNRLRGEILGNVRAGAAKSTGLFTLTVPTGGGKTLASLAFALDHAKRHGLDRIVYAIPFTSVIDQTAEIFRDVLGDDVVLEHHSSIDEEKLGGRTARDKLRLAMEDWAAPIVVTTNVQLFESLHSHRPSRARRLHNLARAVIVLDEAQTIPRPVLRPCVAAIGELAKRYGTSVVLCTATQPALGKADGFPDGPDLDPSRELAPEPDRLTRALARVRLARVGDLDDEALVSALEASRQGLVIVNSRRHALALFDCARAAGLDGVTHLSTRQYAADRVRILAGVRQRLKDGRPCRVIATSLVEAGVDVDFPRVWRAEAGLDQIAQAAGRCNREGKRPIDESLVTVFRAPDHPPPREIAGLVADMGRVSARHDDLLTNAAIRDYFGEVFWRIGPERLDVHGVMKAWRLSAGVPSFDYRKVGEAFRLIDSEMAPVIVAIEAEAKQAIDDLERSFLPPGSAARKLQRFLVQIPPRIRFGLIARGDVRLIRERDLGDQFAVLVTDKLYRADVGLHWEAADGNDLDLLMA
ncbi:CRISPR-associated helicase Cas3' [Siculibacillus lacustris]|uniref:CRISPR-associated helicase Cas3 n=1 Tax=Siculibacillus lacustris TaxID=1549641 RepID=A0A4Q9VR94_9HYPH|nr:CRISPR-associated helicase Cas3' [Siculibacillus lacustris]TBW38408.1 CRISPR-associated helicase Cas3' [Siculibacillus lacustris]